MMHLVWIDDPRGGSVCLRQREDESNALFWLRGTEVKVAFLLAKDAADPCHFYAKAAVAIRKGHVGAFGP